MNLNEVFVLVIRVKNINKLCAILVSIIAASVVKLYVGPLEREREKSKRHTTDTVCQTCVSPLYFDSLTN